MHLWQGVLQHILVVCTVYAGCGGELHCLCRVWWRTAVRHIAINAFTFNRNLSTYYILLYDLVSILNFKAT